jgi:hypothetical protein
MTPSVASALMLTLAVEVPIVALVYARERARMAAAWALATSATNLMMNAWLYTAAGSYDAYLTAGELGATVIEALVYIVVSREHAVGRALFASGVANTASFAAGLVAF